tara:strand:- start:207 stop:569 length:363 start_codon:yes stop_codon:yes gene_type:complete
MSKEENTYLDYWSCVERTADEVLELVNDGEDEGDMLHQACDGSYWTIYYHAAALTMKHTENDDAYWDVMGGDSVPGTHWGEVVCLLATYAFMQDVSDSYYELRTKKEEEKPAPSGLPIGG